jgi:hypothetical protein
MLGRLYGVDAVTSIGGPIVRRIDSTLGWRELYGDVRRTFDVAFVSWTVAVGCDDWTCIDGGLARV